MTLSPDRERALAEAARCAHAYLDQLPTRPVAPDAAALASLDELATPADAIIALAAREP